MRVVVAVVAACCALLGLLALAVLRVGGPVEAGAAPPTPTPPTVSAPPARTVDPSRSAGRPLVDPAWLARTASAAGIPLPALRAYADAELVLRGEQPGCHLAWNTLAGIGWVESEHGTIGGRRLGSDGRPSRPIRGPALDGADGLAAVRGPGGAWARAEGPMQFLPRTWTTWSTDGDGDGTADPQDLDDAALAAARYLCAAGADLGSGPGWVSAIRSYNHSDDYVRSVYAAASAYGGRAR